MAPSESPDGLAVAVVWFLALSGRGRGRASLGRWRTDRTRLELVTLCRIVHGIVHDR